MHRRSDFKREVAETTLLRSSLQYRKELFQHTFGVKNCATLLTTHFGREPEHKK